MTSPAIQQPSPGLPDERFWERYSPRSELPLSSVASASLHLLILVLLLAGGFLLVQAQDTSKPLPAAAVEIGDGPGDGGANNPEEQPQPFKPEAIDRGQNALPGSPNTGDDRVKLQKPVSKTEEPPPQFGDQGQRLLDEANEAEKNLSARAKQVEEKIWNQQTGPTGPNRGKLGLGDMASERKPRKDRWVLNFETRDGGNDYARQLQALGAILAIPQPDGGYLIIRDLQRRPVRGQIEDIATIQRIFWVDNKPESVRSLAVALQLDRVPPWFAAFFPEDFERDLLRKELAFKNRREADIRKTYFRLERKGTNYEPVVVRQEPRTDAK
jgi:hypothetical protein